MFAQKQRFVCQMLDIAQQGFGDCRQRTVGKTYDLQDLQERFTSAKRGAVSSYSYDCDPSEVPSSSGS